MLLSLFFQTYFAIWHWSIFWWVPLVQAFRGGGSPSLRRSLLIALLAYIAAASFFVLSSEVPSVAVVVNSWPRYLLPITPWAVLYVAACHILESRPGYPRFDPTQFPAEP
jgi:hypothetical protein